MVFGTGDDATAGSGGTADLIKDGTTASFAHDVIEASQGALVLVDFWASWCGPCKQLTPILEKIVQSYAGRVRLVKINTDEHPGIAGQLRIQSLPTVYAFGEGRPLDGFTGAQGESTIREFIEKNIGDDSASGIAQVLETGQEALAAGDLQSAAEVFAAVLEEDRQNVAALAGLAQCYLKSGDLERAEQTIAMVPPNSASDPAVQAVKASLQLALKAGDAGDTENLKQQLASNPDDHQARYDLAIALATADSKSEAVDNLLEIVSRKREWNEDAARKQLVEFFDAWGPTDDATVDGRRRLSSLLFS